MANIHIRFRVGITLILLVVSLFIYLPKDIYIGKGFIAMLGGVGLGSCPKEKLCVSYLDVGQGDATFIVSPTGTEVLIDGGRDTLVLTRLGEVMSFFDRTIDYVIPTHPDMDHVAGLIDVLERYEVTTIIRTENESDTNVWKAVEQRIDTEPGVEVITARQGQLYDLGGGAVLEILFPDMDVSGYESNTSSIVARLTYGENEFLFMGDSPKNIEEYLVLTDADDLHADVLKVGHHGSRTSTSELFLETVSPDIAIISTGKDNSYGHPHVEVTDALFNHHVVVKNTADEGTISLISDGVDIVFK